MELESLEVLAQIRHGESDKQSNHAGERRREGKRGDVVKRAYPGTTVR
jgi:hypothetical protein